MNDRLLAIGTGIGSAIVGSAIWSLVVPARGSPAGIAGLEWVRDVGLADWGPCNVGGIAFCVTGTLIGARLVGINESKTLLVLVAAALGLWVVLTVWLFHGLRIQDWIPDPTGG